MMDVYCDEHELGWVGQGCPLCLMANLRTQLRAAEQRGRAYEAAIRETMEEIEYWHADYLADTDSQNGWRRCYDKLKALFTS